MAEKSQFNFGALFRTKNTKSGISTVKKIYYKEEVIVLLLITWLEVESIFQSKKHKIIDL